MFCVSRPLPEFGRVIRIQSAPDDFVPGTVPLRPKNAGDEVPLIFLYPDLFAPKNILLQFLPKICSMGPILLFMAVLESEFRALSIQTL